MKEYRGILKRVGAKEGDMIVNTRANSSVGNVRVSGSVSVIEIGDTVLRDVGCTKDLYDLLDVGKNTILYVHHKLIGKKPIILGIGYPDEGRGFTVRLMAVVANTILSLFLFPILAVMFGLMMSAIVGGVLGVVIMLGGIGLTFYNVFQLVTGYMQASASVRQISPARA